MMTRGIMAFISRNKVEGKTLKYGDLVFFVNTDKAFIGTTVLLCDVNNSVC